MIEYEPLDIQPNLSYVEQPVQVLDRQEKVLRNKSIALVKVLWRNSRVEDLTWELESKCSKSILNYLVLRRDSEDRILLRGGGGYDDSNFIYYISV